MAAMPLSSTLSHTIPRATQLVLTERAVVQVGCPEQLSHKGNEVNKSSKNVLYQFQGIQGDKKEEHRRTIGSYINANAQQRKQPAQEGSCS